MNRLAVCHFDLVLCFAIFYTKIYVEFVLTNINTHAHTRGVVRHSLHMKKRSAAPIRTLAV